MKKQVLIALILSFSFALGYSQSETSDSVQKTKTEKKNKRKKKKYKLPKIDLSHWKVTLPVTNDQGKPYEIEPPEIFDFASNMRR